MKILVYPYDHAFDFIIDGDYKFNIGEIYSLVSERGWGFIGKEKIINGKKLIINENYKKEILDCDAVWFIDSENSIDFEQYILPKITYAVEAKKQILYFRTDIKELKIVKQITHSENLFIPNKDVLKINFEEEIYDISTPVLYVAGMSECVDKCDTIATISQKLKEKGYKVAQIITKQGAELFGEHSVPIQMFSNEISERDKILLFNHFVKQIEYFERPDIIVIGVPGELLPVSRKTVGFMGTMAYEMSRAIMPDIVLINLMYDRYTNEILEYLKKHILFKDEQIIFNIINKYIDVTDSDISSKLSIVKLSNLFVKEKIKNILGDLIYHLEEVSEVERFVFTIEKRLSGKTEVVEM